MTEKTLQKFLEKKPDELDKYIDEVLNDPEEKTKLAEAIKPVIL